MNRRSSSTLPSASRANARLVHLLPFAGRCSAGSTPSAATIPQRRNSIPPPRQPTKNSVCSHSRSIQSGEHSASNQTLLSHHSSSGLFLVSRYSTLSPFCLASLHSSRYSSSSVRRSPCAATLMLADLGFFLFLFWRCKANIEARD